MDIAVIGVGAMGSAIGALLAESGARVLSPLAGRSEQSRRRAAAAGIRNATPAEIAGCPMILSVVPPTQAPQVAVAVMEAVVARGAQPLFADCNAIDPDTARGIGEMIERSGCRFVDAAILGGPPAAGRARRPLFYAAGRHAEEFAKLTAFGLDVRALPAPIGAASALKMSLAAVSKGMTGVLALALQLAEQEQVCDFFVEQLRQSQPGLAGWGASQFPQLAAKGARWAEEMTILEQLLASSPGGSQCFRGLADMFAAAPQVPGDDQARRWAGALLREPGHDAAA